jgi:hypothetical protein
MTSRSFFASSLAALTLALGCSSTVDSSKAGGGGTGGRTATTTATSTGTTTTTATSTGTGTTATGAGGSGGGATGGSDAGLPPPGGDCATDAECPGGHCVAVTAGGFRVCQIPPAPAAGCGSALDQCCPNQPCPGGEACLPGPLVPVCAGVAMEPHNQCAADQCSDDKDCGSSQICALAGTLGLGIRACLPASCKLDADCTAAVGGVCVPVQDPCCNNVAGLFCRYPGTGCRKNGDCPSAQFCDTSSGIAVCTTGGPLCPL